MFAELAHAARPVGVARSLQQLVQPMGAGKSFGTLTGAGGGKFAPMAGGKPAAAAATGEGGDGGDGGSARSAGLVSRCGPSSSAREYSISEFLMPSAYATSAIYQCC